MCKLKTCVVGAMIYYIVRFMVDHVIFAIIIMYIYPPLINALSVHMIHIKHGA